MAKSYTKKYEVNYHDSNYKLKCKLSSIVNFLCDAGTNQSEVLGDTIEAMMAKNYAWVFYKYNIKIYKYPSYRDTISITTEPIGFNKFYAYRKYYIKSEEGEILGEAVALFFLINLKRRRPMRIPHEQYELYDADGNDMDRDVDMENIRKVEKEDYHKKFDIRYSDIDSNGHVNNVNYLEWAIESVPIEVVKDYEIKGLKIVFEKEVTYGDNVQVSATLIREEVDKLITVHTIRNNEGKEVTKLEATWEKE